MSLGQLFQPDVASSSAMQPYLFKNPPNMIGSCHFFATWATAIRDPALHVQAWGCLEPILLGSELGCSLYPGESEGAGAAGAAR